MEQITEEEIKGVSVMVLQAINNIDNKNYNNVRIILEDIKNWTHSRILPGHIDTTVNYHGDKPRGFKPESRSR